MKNKTIKTITAILLISAMLLCTGCGEQKESSAVHTMDNLLAAKTREELAQLVNCNTSDLDQFLLYMKNLSMILPNANEKAPEKFERGTTEDNNLVWVTDAKLRTMIKPILITTSNWKDYFEARIDQSEWLDISEDGEETVTYVDMPTVDVKKNYYYDWPGLHLEFVNNESGEQVIYDMGWSEELAIDNGKICRVTYDDTYNAEYHEFSFDDYTCTKADGIIYEYNIPDDIVSVGLFLGEDGPYYESRLADCPYEYEESDKFVCIMHDGDESPWLIGYSLIGEDVYCR